MTRRWKTSAFPFTEAESVPATMSEAAVAAAGIATASNQTTILNRLGAWTGSGINTVLGAFIALFSKVASKPSDITGTMDPATDSVESLAEAIDAINPGTVTGTNTIQFEITNGDGTLLENATVSLRLNDILKATGDTAATGRLSGTGLAVQATGTYELSVTCDGYNGHTADLVVTAGVNTLVEVGLTALAITAPTDTGTATGRLDMHAKDTTTGAYQSIYVRQTTRRTATGHGDSKEWRELVSNALGVIEAPFWKSQSYEAKRGRDGTAVAFTVGTDDGFYLPSVLGEP